MIGAKLPRMSCDEAGKMYPSVSIAWYFQSLLWHSLMLIWDEVWNGRGTRDQQLGKSND